MEKLSYPPTYGPEFTPSRLATQEEDVDGHHQRAKCAVVAILSEREDGPPDRRDRVEDLEEHRRVFTERRKGSGSDK